MTNRNKLTLYRRHAGCKLPAKVLDQCECPLWVHGKVRGEFIRRSLDTRALSTAIQYKEDLINGISDDAPAGLQVVAPRGAETLEYAAAEFLKANAKLASNTQSLYRRAVESFVEWSAKHGLVYLRQIETSHIALYFQEAGREWKRNTAQSRLVHLRVFFNYACRTRRWIAFTPTADRTLNHKKNSRAASRAPFTPSEITSILAAVERMPEASRDRARALVLLLLYTGMRISDATFFERACLTPRNTADYHVVKTRKQISLPPTVQAPALDALAKLPPSRIYFFQPDREDDYHVARTALRNGEEFSVLIPNYEARVRETTALVTKVLGLAGLSGACHRFRDTFAISLLTSGVDVFTVSQMLGHSDVRITQEHYLKLWVPGYRERMSAATANLAYQFPLAS